MEKNAELYYKSACALKLPLQLTDHIAGFVIKLGRRLFFFRRGGTPFNCGSSIGIANNKFCANKILEAAGFPVPKALAMDRDTFKKINLEEYIQDMTFPLVIKPMINTSLGEDVLCNITTVSQLKHFMTKRFKDHKFLLIEEFHDGLNSYRVLVFHNKVIGVVARRSARVVGDGIHSIRALIALHNIEREKFSNTVSLGPIKVDEEYHIRLKELNMTLDTIPNDNETVVLCYTCNSTRGGTMESLGNKICKENARLLCAAANALDLNLVGFDVLCEDICIPIETSRGMIIEANHTPDITIHENPMSGIRNQVSKKMLFRLILKHPVAYLRGLYQHAGVSVCVKGTLLLILLLISYTWTHA